MRAISRASRLVALEAPAIAVWDGMSQRRQTAVGDMIERQDLRVVGHVRQLDIRR
jgi:hypothetical protein